MQEVKTTVCKGACKNAQEKIKLSVMLLIFELHCKYFEKCKIYAVTCTILQKNKSQFSLKFGCACFCLLS